MDFIDNMAWITFRLITTTLLSLLLPLSFLVVARMSTINYLISVNDINHSISFPYSLLFSSSRQHYPLIPIHFLICMISLSSLLHSLSASNMNHHYKPLRKPYLYIAWMLLFTLQVSVTMGIEGTIRYGIDKYDFGLGQEKKSLGSCVVMMFFLGLHETMLFWGRTVVKPVVDDTVYGGCVLHHHRRRRHLGYWLEKAALGLSYGGLWWWRLRCEVDALVAVPEMKREMMTSVGVQDFVGWMVYHLMVCVGIVRVIKWCLCFVVNRRNRDHCKLNDDQV